MSGLHDYVTRVVADLTAPSSTYISVATPRPAVVEDLGVGEVHLSIPSSVREIVAEAARTSTFRYVDPQGDRDLCEAYRNWNRDLNLDDRVDVLVTAGGKEALWLVFALELTPASSVWLPRPGWPPYKVWADTAAVRIQTYHPQALIDNPRDALDGCRPGGGTLILNYPHSPTGITATQAQLDAIVSVARGLGLGLVADEVYREFAEEGRPSILKSDGFDPLRDAVVDSTSKAIAMAGLRIGFVTSSPERIRALKVVRAGIASCVSSTAQRIVTQLLQTRESAAWFAEMRSTVRSRILTLAHALRVAKIEVSSSGALYVWARCDERRLAADGRVGFYPGAMFGAPGHIRLCPARCAVDSEWIAQVIGKCK